MKLFWKLKKYNISLLLCFTVFFYFLLGTKVAREWPMNEELRCFLSKSRPNTFCVYTATTRNYKIREKTTITILAKQKQRF